MRRSALIAVVLVLGFLAAATAGEPKAMITTRPSRGAQPVGTWVWLTYLGPGAALPALVTYHMDGTLTGVDGTLFGFATPSGTPVSPFHGVWQNTGWQSIGGTSLFLIFDATKKSPVAYGRARSALQFLDEDHFEGVVFLEVLPCMTGPLSCPDPLDPAARWMAYPGVPATGIPVTGARLERVPAGPLP